MSAGFIQPLVGFDKDKFTIVAWSRNNCINLVNLSRLSSEPIIERKIATFAQHGQSDFIIKKEVYGMSIHFIAKVID